MAKKKRRTLTAVSQSDLEKELSRRRKLNESKVDRLMVKREKLRTELAETEAAIIEAGGKLARTGTKKRPKNTNKLSDALAKTLRSRTLSVTEVSERVQQDGYKTTSPNFRTIVNQTLLKDPRFKRVSRGKYTAKS